MTGPRTTADGPSVETPFRRIIERRPLQSFVLLAVSISWLAWGTLAVYDLVPGLNLAGALWLLGGLGPPISAVIVLGIAESTHAVWRLLDRLMLWRVERRWYAVAVLLPGVVVGVALLVDAVVFDVPTPVPSVDLFPLFVGSILANMVIGGGLEEIGWRGFALPRLQAEYSALTASLVIGAVWVGWHAPLFVVPGAIQAELAPLPFFVQGTALSVLFTWLYNSTRGSLLLVVILHGAVNAWLTSVWFLRGSVNSTTLWVFAGLVGVTAVCVVVMYGSEHLSRHRRQIGEATGPDGAR